mgnify:FL=1|jgi:hypothetical protein
MRPAKLLRSLFSKTKKLKHIPPEPYVVLPADAQKSFSELDLSHLNIKDYKQIKLTYKR